MFKAVSLPSTVVHIYCERVSPHQKKKHCFSLQKKSVYQQVPDLRSCKQRRDNLLRGLWWLSLSSGQLLSPIVVFSLCLPQFSQTGSHFIFFRSRLDAFGALWVLAEYQFVARDSVLNQPELLQDPFLQVDPRYITQALCPELIL